MGLSLECTYMGFRGSEKKISGRGDMLACVKVGALLCSLQPD